MEHKEPKGRIVFSGLGGRKGANSLDKIRISGVLRLRAPNALSPDQSLRRFAQDDDFVEITKKDIP